MKENKIKDIFAKDKETSIREFEKRDNLTLINFGIIDVTLSRHRPNKDYLCYICDEVIKDFYYCQWKSHSGAKKKICIQCLARIIDLFNIDLDKWDWIMLRRMHRISEYKENIKRNNNE